MSGIAEEPRALARDKAGGDRVARDARRFVGARFAHAGFSRFGFHDRGRFFHHRRFGRFAFFGGPFIYAGYYGGYYDGCWRRVWTPYGWQWADVCGYGYGNGYY